jgi:protein phosphatase
MKLSVAYMTHKGLEKYECNQDSIMLNGVLFSKTSMVNPEEMNIYSDDSSVLFALSDGMGNTPHAEVASGKVLELLDTFNKEQTSFLPMKTVRKIQDSLENIAIVTPKYRGMGATLAGVYLQEDQVIVFNTGDSRIYRIRENKMVQLSKDHTQAQKMLNCGEITQEEFENLSSAYNMLEGYLVAGELDEDEVLVEVKKEALQTGDTFLVCSDGVHDVLSDEKILQVLNQRDTTIEKCKFLFESVYAVAEDNISIILLEWGI